MKFLNTSLLLIVLSALFVPNSTYAGTQKLEQFGENPGELLATVYSPKTETSSIVLLLHGCAQNAEWLAEHTGLMSAAKAEEFTLLMPQQVKANNIQLCFNWFSEADQLMGSGETASIMNMIETVKKTTKADKVYVVGLSAGGAMATSLIAQYPNEFQAAGIIAGVGYPCADSLIKALTCMKSGSTYQISDLAEKVQKLHGETVQWPNITVMAGTEDTIVSPQNATQIQQQWQIIMDANKKITGTNVLDGITASRMENAQDAYIELLMIEGIGHGWPINSKSPNAGKAAPFVLETTVNATDYLINQWQL
ncbi:MAG: PHB depolymerase family esterase [Gammaproteobacteria bacterium]|nr:PHB depolymerase family esterase [Gammaproteobacteria bacterium]